MKKSLHGWILAVMGLLVLTGMAGCQLPDYQLSWSVSIDSLLNGSSAATVTVENVGFEDLKNVSVEVSAVDDWGNVLSSGTLYFGNVNTGASESQSITLYHSGIADSVQVTSVGWDSEDSWGN